MIKIVDYSWNQNVHDQILLVESELPFDILDVNVYECEDGFETIYVTIEKSSEISAVGGGYTAKIFFQYSDRSGKPVPEGFKYLKTLTFLSIGFEHHLRTGFNLYMVYYK